MATVRNVKRLYNNYIDVEGVLLTMYDARLNLTGNGQTIICETI